MKIAFALTTALVMFGLVCAQYSPSDSVMIRITVSTCPMMFTIDHLPRHPYFPGVSDTFFLRDMYWAWLGIDSLDWQATYMVGDLSDSSGTILEQAIRVIDTGCVPLDFELSTEAVFYDASGDSFGTPWWEPNDTTVPMANKYILRAIATGINTARLTLNDTLRFKLPESYYHIVGSTPREIKDSTVVPGASVCCFYSRDLYGYDLIPTIDSTGVNLRGWPSGAPEPGPDNAFYLHMALTTPEQFGTDMTYTTGMIILHIRGMAHE